MTQKKLLGCTLVLMVATAGWLYLSRPTYGPRIEAESGVIKGPFKIVKDGNLSGGGYIQSPDRRRGSRGEATYFFQIEQHGIYKFRAQAYGHSDKGDSFYVSIDSQPEVIWDVGSLDRVWRETTITKRRNPRVIGNTDPLEVELTPGSHMLVIKERELNAGLDYVQFEMVKPLATASFLSGFQLNQFVQGSLALCLVALSLMAIGLVNRAGWLRRQDNTPVDTRLGMLEKRLGDMQDVIISLDEQLKRMEYKFERSSEPELTEKD